jgi:hypothetical protein
MNQNESEAENGDEPTVDERRAEWEEFQFTVCPEVGYVNVANLSHGDANNHTCSMEVNDGEATGCSCPHAVHRGAHCKHQIAVENSPIVLSSPQAASQVVMTDGGTEDDRFLPPEHPQHVPEDEDEDDQKAGRGLGTVTGWASGESTVDEEEVDETPL